jgi:hypothetical protein
MTTIDSVYDSIITYIAWTLVHPYLKIIIVRTEAKDEQAVTLFILWQHPSQGPSSAVPGYLVVFICLGRYTVLT